MCISRIFSEGGTNFRQGVVPQILPLQQPIFGKSRERDWTPYPPSLEPPMLLFREVIVVFHNGGDKEAQLGEFR